MPTSGASHRFRRARSRSQRKPQPVDAVGVAGEQRALFRVAEIGDDRVIRLHVPIEAAEQFVGREIAGEQAAIGAENLDRSEEHTSELQSLMRISYAVFCLKKKNKHTNTNKVAKN